MSASFSTVNLRRLIVFLYLLLFAGIAVGSGVFLWKSREEYLHLRKAEQNAKVRLAEAQQKLHEQEVILEQLRTDRDYVEMVIRRHLYYAKPGERIFLFSEQEENLLRAPSGR